MSKDQNKYEVISRLIAGESPTDIAKTRDDIPYPTIIRWNREYKDAKANNALESLLNLNNLVIEEILDGVRANTPAGLEDKVGDLLDTASINVASITSLSDELVKTATEINKRIRSMTVAAVHVSEIDVLTESLCKLQTAFFNKQTTQVNVQNNYDATGGHRFSSFLSDKPSN